METEDEEMTIEDDRAKGRTIDEVRRVEGPLSPCNFRLKHQRKIEFRFLVALDSDSEGDETSFIFQPNHRLL